MIKTLIKKCINILTADISFMYIKKSKNNAQKTIKILIKKCINIPVMQISFMYMLKNQCYENYKN